MVMEAKCCENAIRVTHNEILEKYIAVLKNLLPALTPEQRKVFVKEFYKADSGFAVLIDLL